MSLAVVFPTGTALGAFMASPAWMHDRTLARTPANDARPDRSDLSGNLVA
jgi:hypothetical protein